MSETKPGVLQDKTPSTLLAQSEHIAVSRAVYAMASPQAPGDAGALHADKTHVWIVRDDASASLPSERWTHASFVRGWYVPLFVERVLGLGVAGAARQLVTTVSMPPWLELETAQGQRVSLMLGDHEQAHEILEVLGLGPGERGLSVELFGSVSTGIHVTWLSSRRAFATSLSVASVPLAALEFWLASVHALGAMSVLGLGTGALGLIAWRSLRARLSRLRAPVPALDARVAIELVGNSPLSLDPTKIESIVLQRGGFVIDYQGASRPLEISLLASSEAARAIEGEYEPLAKLRMIHAFADWLLRLRSLRTRPRSPSA
ncbi:MAG: hypothetical protein Q8Q09_22095 [Deltaproteobacteria bacterium]|nr:hypothetical protein [Deltaproteobacteria bacterium]